MLTPEYLTRCTIAIVDLYQALEDEIIRDIARRLINTDFEMTQSALWQMEKIQQAGVVYDDAIKQIALITKKSETAIKALFDDASAESLAFDDGVYKKAGLNPLPIKQSPAMLQLLTSSMQKCGGELKNLTNTTAVTAKTAFIQACDLAHMKITSGAFDYNTAIRQAVQQLSSQGLNVLYPTGNTAKLDVAVRRAMLTGVSQTCAKLQIQRMDDMESDLVETTAHGGARLSHITWQGQVFSRSGKSKEYSDFESATGYGTGPGLCGYNCRHSFSPFYEGVSKRAYTGKDLQELADHKVSYGGQEFTDYDASQTQRQMERDIRATKRELIGYEAGIKGANKDPLKNSFQADFYATSAKLKGQEAKLQDFLTQTGRAEERARVQVLGFGRIPAQKAVWANKKIQKALTGGADSSIIKLDSKTVRDIYKKNVSEIRSKIDTSKDLESQARQAYSLRNQYRTNARDLMLDSTEKKKLYVTKPNRLFDELLADKMKRKRLTREEALTDIIATASETNKGVDDLFR